MDRLDFPHRLLIAAVNIIALVLLLTITLTLLITAVGRVQP